MAIVLGDVRPKSSIFVRFLWAEGLNANDIRKEMFAVYDGKCPSRKAVHNWVDKYSQRRSKVADDARQGRPVEIATEATVHRMEEFGFSTHWQSDGTSASMLVVDMLRNKLFSMCEYNMFSFYIHL
jgi:hypothetical protein